MPLRNLILVLLVSVSAWAGHFPVTDTVAQSVTAAAPPTPSCPQLVAVRGKYDLSQGLADLYSLQSANNYLESLRGGLTPELLYQMGVIRDGNNPHTITTRKGDQAPTNYRQLMLPLAYTGVLLPNVINKKPVKTDQYEAVIIFIPGIGFESSVANSVMEVASTFTKVGNPAFELGDGRKFRAIGIPLDAPLNGLAEDAPYALGSPEGNLAVLRHAQLILEAFYPGKKIIVAGRSQGGLVAARYAMEYSDFTAAVGLNPSHTRRDIVEHVVAVHEDFDLMKKLGMDPNIHPLSWNAHLDYTELYDIENPQRETRVPTLVLLGTEDKGYPQPKYRLAFQEWVDPMQVSLENRDIRSGLRRAVQIPGGHNTWMRPNGKGSEEFDRNLEVMVDFLAPLVYP